MALDSLTQITSVLEKIKSVFGSAKQLLTHYEEYLQHNYTGPETTEIHQKLLGALRTIEAIERSELNTEYREGLRQLAGWQETQMKDLALLSRAIDGMPKNSALVKNAELLMREFMMSIDSELKNIHHV